MLLVEIGFGETWPVFRDPCRIDPARLAALTGPEAPAEVSALVRSATSALGEGVTGVGLALAFAAVLQAPHMIYCEQGMMIRPGEGRALLVVPADSKMVGGIAILAGCSLAYGLLGPQGAATPAPMAIAQFRKIANERSLDTATLNVARAARRLGVPVFRPHPRARLIQLGHCAQMRMVSGRLMDPPGHGGLLWTNERGARLYALHRLGLPTADPQNAGPVEAVSVLEVRGGICTDPAAHPDNAELVRRAAEVVGLDAADLALSFPDTTSSWRDQDGVIEDIVSASEAWPVTIEDPLQVNPASMVHNVFHGANGGRIPTAGVTGSIGKTTTCQILASVLRANGATPGLVTTQGMWSGDRLIGKMDAAGGREAARLLADPAVDVGVFELARGALIRRGMHLDQIDVAAVLNVDDNHLGQDGIETIEEMAEIKSIIVRRATQTVILNADDPLVLGMRRLVRAPELILFTRRADNPDVAAHAADGGGVLRLVETADGARFVLEEDGKKIFDIPASVMPAIGRGRSGSLEVNGLFAAGIAHALGYAPEAIEAGLAAFTSSAEQNPGRHNRIEGFPFEVVLHWAKSAQTLEDLAETLGGDGVTGVRRICLTAQGSRNDEWIQDVARAAAGRFDRYYCAEMSNLRGRQSGEIAAVLAEGLRGAGIPDQDISTCSGEDDGIERALKDAAPGDQVVVLTYETHRALETIEGLRAQLQSA